MKKNKAIKNYIKKAVAAVMVAVLLSIGIIPSFLQPEYVFAYQSSELESFIELLLTSVYTTAGVVTSTANGSFEDFRRFYSTMQNTLESIDQGLTYEEFLNKYIHSNNENNTVTYDAPLYNLINVYVKGEQSDPNSGVTSITYKQLRVDKMVYGDTAGDGSDNFYYTYAAASIQVIPFIASMISGTFLICIIAQVLQI